MKPNNNDNIDSLMTAELGEVSSQLDADSLLLDELFGKSLFRNDTLSFEQLLQLNQRNNNPYQFWGHRLDREIDFDPATQDYAPKSSLFSTGLNGVAPLFYQRVPGLGVASLLISGAFGATDTRQLRESAAYGDLINTGMGFAGKFSPYAALGNTVLRGGATLLDAMDGRMGWREAGLRTGSDAALTALTFYNPAVGFSTRTAVNALHPKNLEMAYYNYSHPAQFALANWKTIKNNPLKWLTNTFIGRPWALITGKLGAKTTGAGEYDWFWNSPSVELGQAKQLWSGGTNNGNIGAWSTFGGALATDITAEGFATGWDPKLMGQSYLNGLKSTANLVNPLRQLPLTEEDYLQASRMMGLFGAGTNMLTQGGYTGNRAQKAVENLMREVESKYPGLLGQLRENPQDFNRPASHIFINTGQQDQGTINFFDQLNRRRRNFVESSTHPLSQSAQWQINTRPNALEINAKLASGEYKIHNIGDNAVLIRDAATNRVVANVAGGLRKRSIYGMSNSSVTPEEHLGNLWEQRMSTTEMNSEINNMVADRIIDLNKASQLRNTIAQQGRRPLNYSGTPDNTPTSPNPFKNSAPNSGTTLSTSSAGPTTTTTGQPIITALVTGLTLGATTAANASTGGSTDRRNNRRRTLPKRPTATRSTQPSTVKNPRHDTSTVAKTLEDFRRGDPLFKYDGNALLIYGRDNRKYHLTIEGEGDNRKYVLTCGQKTFKYSPQAWKTAAHHLAAYYFADHANESDESAQYNPNPFNNFGGALSPTKKELGGKLNNLKNLRQ